MSRKPYQPPPPRNDFDDPAFAVRFFSRGQPDTNGCLIWTGPKDKSGRAMFRLRRKHTTAQRVAWRLVHGPIPEGMYTTHLCGNPACIRVSHLALITKAELDARYQEDLAAASQAGNFGAFADVDEPPEWRAEVSCA